jgi:hypothetical protein
MSKALYGVRVTEPTHSGTLVTWSTKGIGGIKKDEEG